MQIINVSVIILPRVTKDVKEVHHPNALLKCMGGDTYGCFNRIVNRILKSNCEIYRERFMEVG